MIRLIVTILILFSPTGITVAQQNWAAVPCFELKKGDAIGRLVNNNVHNELILASSYSYKICNETYKGFFAFNGSTFHDMDLGIEAQNPNLWLGAALVGQCVDWNGKALIIGNFKTVGSDTLDARYMALWNGSAWDTFPHPFWNNHGTQQFYTSYGMGKVLKDNGKLWMFTGYDTSGTSTYIPVLYDGTTFTTMPQIPVNNRNQVIQAVKYQNKLVVTGNFLNFPSLTFCRLAQFDGTSWSEMGNGVPGNLTGAWDLKVYNDTLYIAGNFRKSDGCKGNYIMKWDGDQLIDAGFGGWCGYGMVTRLLTFKNRLYAFGAYNCAANQKAFGVAFYENGIWTVPQDSIGNNGIYDAAVYQDAIYIGGSFASINGDSTIHHFAKLACPDFDAASGCISSVIEEMIPKLEFTVFPNPAGSTIKLMCENVNSGELTIKNILGQTISRNTELNLDSEIEIDSLPAGIYFLSLIAGDKFGITKLIKE